MVFWIQTFFRRFCYREAAISSIVLARKSAFIIVNLLLNCASIDKLSCKPRTGLIRGPISGIDVGVGGSGSFYPLLYRLHETCPCLSGDEVIRAGVVSVGEVAVVEADWRPYSVGGFICDFEEDIQSVTMVLLYSFAVLH